jgi:hypothetical protein
MHALSSAGRSRDEYVDVTHSINSRAKTMRVWRHIVILSSSTGVEIHLAFVTADDYHTAKQH